MPNASHRDLLGRSRDQVNNHLSINPRTSPFGIDTGSDGDAFESPGSLSPRHLGGSRPTGGGLLAPTPYLAAMTYAQWERKTEWPLAGAALGFLGIYAWTVLGQPERTSAALAEHAVQVIWILFIIDYLTRLMLADRRGRWFVYHLHELAIVVLPILRPLRLLRLLTVVSFLQRSVGGALRGRVVTYAITGTTLLIAVASLAMLDAERDAPDATITTFPDALWWAVVTVTTVGYGDLSPVTPTGRLIAVGLMVAGIALLGVVTATLASWLVQKVAEQDEANQAATQQQVAELSQQIQALRAELGGEDSSSQYTESGFSAVRNP